MQIQQLLAIWAFLMIKIFREICMKCSFGSNTWKEVINFLAVFSTTHLTKLSNSCCVVSSVTVIASPFSREPFLLWYETGKWSATDYRRVDVQRTLASTRPPLLRSWLQDFSISSRRSRIRVIGSESRGGRHRRNMNLTMWRNLTKIREKMFAAIIRNTWGWIAYSSSVKNLFVPNIKFHLKWRFLKL